MKFNVRVVILFSLFIFIGCDSNSVNSSEEIRQLIESKLSGESNSADIIEFINSSKWIYSFNKYSNRFQAANPKENKYPEFLGRNQIHIYVDEKGYFVNATVKKFYGSWL